MITHSGMESYRCVGNEQPLLKALNANFFVASTALLLLRRRLLHLSRRLQFIAGIAAKTEINAMETTETLQR